jgi:hypothetical protein
MSDRSSTDRPTVEVGEETTSSHSNQDKDECEPFCRVDKGRPGSSSEFKDPQPVFESNSHEHTSATQPVVSRTLWYFFATIVGTTFTYIFAPIIVDLIRVRIGTVSIAMNQRGKEDTHVQCNQGTSKEVR